jgi:hypothetical protein
VAFTRADCIKGIPRSMERLSYGESVDMSSHRCPLSWPSFCLSLCPHSPWHRSKFLGYINGLSVGDRRCFGRKEAALYSRLFVGEFEYILLMLESPRILFLWNGK